MKEIGNIYDRYDLFASEVPAFHIQGQKKVGTFIGCFLSIFTVTSVLVYGCIRGFYLVTGNRPLVSSYIVRGGHDAKEAIDLEEYDFKIAFSAQKIEQDEQQKIDDADFIEW